MIGLFREALAVQGFLSDRGWPFCFIGGVALQHWGEPRVTRDLLVLKAFADRLQDRADLAGIAQRRGRSLDWDAAIARLTPLAETKGDAGILERVLALREQFGG